MEIGDRHREMLSLSAVVHHRILMNDPTWKELGDQAISIAEDLGDNSTKVDLLLMMADAYGLDELDQGLRLIKKAYKIAQEINYKGAQVELLYWLGAEFERDGDYVTLLQDFEEKRLKLSQELGWRLIEARSLMYMGQTIGLYLGEYHKGLSYLDKAETLWRDVDFRVFVYLRKAQILIELGRLEDACYYLKLARPLAAEFVQGIGKVGFKLLQVIYHIKVGSLNNLMRALEGSSEVLKLVDEQNLVSRQYRMAAACKACQACLLVSTLMKQGNDISGYKHYRQKALKYSQMALDTFHDFKFTQVIEVVSEEILCIHGMALLENGKQDEGKKYIAMAYEEMTRKLSLIPQASPFRESYAKIPLHKDITAKHEELT
jgi:tetratricopeptide (TPR) repeat protein